MKGYKGYQKKRELEYQIVTRFEPEAPEMVRDEPFTKKTVVKAFKNEKRKLELWARRACRPMPIVRLRRVHHGRVIRSSLGQSDEGPTSPVEE